MTDILQSSREEINKINVEIVSLMAEFRALAFQTGEDCGCDYVPCTKSEAVDQLTNLIVTHTQFKHDSKAADGLKAPLKGLLSRRFDAVKGVVISKKKKGLQTSYDAERHQAVIDGGGVLAKTEGLSELFGQALFGFIADNFVKMQDPYLQNNQGPYANSYD